jgi:hypothetical protein
LCKTAQGDEKKVVGKVIFPQKPLDKSEIYDIMIIQKGNTPNQKEN